MRKFALIGMMVLLLIGGCFPGAPAQYSKNTSLPMITSFYANPPVITTGQSSNLLWNVTGASSVTISPNVGTVGPSGSLTVAPANGTTYTLIATNGSGSQTASATVTVNPQTSPPVVNSFNLSPSFINPGQTASLTWNVTGATSVRIDPGIGNVPLSGSQPVSPGYTTTYILTANNPAGVITNTATLSVSSYPTYSAGSSYSSYPPYPVYPYSSYGSLPIIVTFSIDPPVIAPGESTVMRWDVAGANSVFISPGPGPVAASGALIIAPGVTTYYTLTATNSAGSTNAAATVSVYPYAYYNYPKPNPIIISPFEEEEHEFPPVVTPPVVIPPVVTPPPPVTSPPPTERGERGENRREGENTGRLPRIESFSSSPTNINLGNSTQLQWKTNGATSVNISPNVGSVPPSGTMTITPNHTTNYKITASNSSGVVQHTQEVTVPRSMRSRND